MPGRVPGQRAVQRSAASGELARPLDRALDQGAAVLEREFGLDVLAVALDGLAAEVQRFGDEPGAQPAADEPENLQFAVGQTFDVGIGRLGCVLRGGALRAARQPRDGVRGDLIADIDGSGQHAVDREQEPVGLFLLHDVPPRTGAQGAFGVEGLVVHRKHEGQQLRLANAQVFDQLDAVALAQRQVDQRQIGLQAFGQRQRVGRVTRLAADDEVGLLVEHNRQALAQDGMVIHEQNPHFLGLDGRRRRKLHGCHDHSWKKSDHRSGTRRLGQRTNDFFPWDPTRPSRYAAKNHRPSASESMCCRETFIPSAPDVCKQITGRNKGFSRPTLKAVEPTAKQTSAR